MRLELERIGAVFFDFDGVIVNTNAGIRGVWSSVALAYGLEITNALFDKAILGQPGHKVVEALFADFSAKQREEVLKKIDEQEEAIEGIAVLGVDSFINQLVDRDITIALVTGSWNTKIDRVLKSAGIDDRFDFRVSRENTINGKPDPEPYLKALNSLRNLRSPTANALVFEDSPVGVTSALRAGCHCIGISHFNEVAENELINAGALATLPNFDGLVVRQGGNDLLVLDYSF